MNILIVGNVLKDVYLNLDTRKDFELDRSGINWLDLSFDASAHPYFSRSCSFAGAAVSEDVLSNLGLSASVSYHDEDPTYRLILVADGGVSYFVPENKKPTVFNPPAAPVDYIFVDRSAEITEETAASIEKYLEFSTSTKLIVYVKDSLHPPVTSL